MKPEQIAYEWFARQWANGTQIGKDEFLMDRTKWDDMQTALFEGEHSMEHDEVKSLVRNMDKRGMLGGVAASRTYWDQLDVLAERAENRKQTGHPGGDAGIIDDLAKWAAAVNGTRPEGYYEDMHAAEGYACFQAAKRAGLTPETDSENAAIDRLYLAAMRFSDYARQKDEKFAALVAAADWTPDES